MKTKTIAIDFDGTICKKQSYGDGQIWQEPNEGAAKIINELKDDNYRIVVYTVRLSPDRTPPEGHPEYTAKKLVVNTWLEKHGIPVDEVVGHKPDAIAYIDDRAIRFTNWQDMSNYFLQ